MILDFGENAISSRFHSNPWLGKKKKRKKKEKRVEANKTANNWITEKVKFLDDYQGPNFK